MPGLVDLIHIDPQWWLGPLPVDDFASLVTACPELHRTGLAKQWRWLFWHRVWHPHWDQIEGMCTHAHDWRLIYKHWVTTPGATKTKLAFECEVCHERFSLLKKLHSHQRKKHPQELLVQDEAAAAALGAGGTPACHADDGRGLCRQQPDLASNGFAYELWPEAPPALQVGARVFVRLKSDKQTGAARITSLPADCTGSVANGVVTEGGVADTAGAADAADDVAGAASAHAGPGRYGVRFDCDGSTRCVRAGRLTLVKDRATKRLLICGDTAHYRTLGRTQVTARDTVLEIGSSYGVATDVLFAASGGRVTGIDNSPSLVEESKARYPHCDFRLCDALQGWEVLLQHASGATAVFIDIGGNRKVEHGVLELLHFVETRLASVTLVVIKNRALKRKVERAVRGRLEVGMGIKTQS
jgi:hypothetical protein